MNRKRLKNWGICFIVGGLLLIASAFFLIGYNLWEDKKAGDLAESVVRELYDSGLTIPTSSVEQEVAPGEYEIPDYMLNPEMDMPEESVDDLTYIGILEIPSSNLKLPIASEWSYPNLRKAPCRYAGSAYTNDLIIAGHNYPNHFRCLSKLGLDDEICFTDMDGNVFRYTITEQTILQSNHSKELEEGTWDLTLFTCTIGGQYRVVVRCKRVS